MITASILTPFLISCDSANEIKVVEVCDKYPTICEQLQEDNWCRVERRDVLVNYYRKEETNDDDYKYKLLLAYEGYAKCMEKASLIEHKKLKSKKNRRINNHVNALQHINDLSNETVNSENPLLMYYHWSRNEDKEALEKLLQLEGSVLVANPEAQFNYATYYIKKDPNKTFDFLYRALELYEKGDKINAEIFMSLASLFADLKLHKQAYIWLKILEMYDEETEIDHQKSLEQYQITYDLNADFLNQVAKLTLEKIKNGKFQRPNQN